MSFDSASLYAAIMNGQVDRVDFGARSTAAKYLCSVKTSPCLVAHLAKCLPKRFTS